MLRGFDGGKSLVKGEPGRTTIGPYTEVERLISGKGDDKLIASGMVEYLHGGAGADTFVFRDTVNATIQRFQTGVDKIKVNSLDDYTFKGRVFYGDTDGDGAWDLAIHVKRGVINDDDVL